jgi:DNA-binding response OmpR family regulator
MLAKIAGSGDAVDTKKTVLIVEDDELVLESIDLHLSASDGYQTIRVQGAAGALSHMQATPHIDVIVADVILAGPMSGIDLCRKAIEHHPGIAVVVTTADPEVDCADVPSRGVFLRKPFGGEQLLAAIGAALERATPTSA